MGGSSMNSMMGKLIGSDSGSTNALTLFKSKKILQDVIYSSGCQMQKVQKPHELRLFSNFYDNVISELAWYQKKYSKTVKRRIDPIHFVKVSYPGLYKKNIQIHFVSSKNFEVFDGGNTFRQGIYFCSF